MTLRNSSWHTHDNPPRKASRCFCNPQQQASPSPPPGLTTCCNSSCTPPPPPPFRPEDFFATHNQPPMYPRGLTTFASIFSYPPTHPRMYVRMYDDMIRVAACRGRERSPRTPELSPQPQPQPQQQQPQQRRLRHGSSEPQPLHLLPQQRRVRYGSGRRGSDRRLWHDETSGISGHCCATPRDASCRLHASFGPR